MQSRNSAAVNSTSELVLALPPSSMQSLRVTFHDRVEPSLVVYGRLLSVTVQRIKTIGPEVWPVSKTLVRWRSGSKRSRFTIKCLHNSLLQTSRHSTGGGRAFTVVIGDFASLSQR